MPPMRQRNLDKIYASEGYFLSLQPSGRPISEFNVKAAREVALKKLLDRIGIAIVQEEGIKGPTRRRLSINLHASRGKAWLRAYQQLKPHEMVVRPRPTGHPMYV